MSGAGAARIGFSSDALRRRGSRFDLPFDVGLRSEFDPDMYEPLRYIKPAASRVQIERKGAGDADSVRASVIVAGGGVNADRATCYSGFARTDQRTGDPYSDGLGLYRSPLIAGMVGLQTAHRYSSARSCWHPRYGFGMLTVLLAVAAGPLRNILRGEKSSISILNRRKLAACCARIWASFPDAKQR